LAPIEGIALAAGWQVIPGTMATINRVLDVLEKRGVELIENGVRLTRRPRRWPKYLGPCA
jgi:hypothetical protein